jgi:hypothetical protein
MFSQHSKRLAVLALSLLALSGLALAQWGMPDFSGVDFNAIVAAQSAETQAQINAIMGQAMQQRGPEIWAAYNQCLQTAGYCGRSFDEFALEYVSTNGFTDGGAWARQQQINTENLGRAWQGVQQAEANSAAAIQGLNNNYAQNQWEAGNVLYGNSTWTNPLDNTNHTVPYTWQPNTYNTYSGQTYYVDYTGQYFLVDPNNTGWMYPLNPWQAGQ